MSRARGRRRSTSISTRATRSRPGRRSSARCEHRGADPRYVLEPPGRNLAAARVPIPRSNGTTTSRAASPGWSTTATFRRARRAAPDRARSGAAPLAQRRRGRHVGRCPLAAPVVGRAHSLHVRRRARRRRVGSMARSTPASISCSRPARSRHAGSRSTIRWSRWPSSGIRSGPHTAAARSPRRSARHARARA